MKRSEVFGTLAVGMALCLSAALATSGEDTAGKNLREGGVFYPCTTAESNRYVFAVTSGDLKQEPKWPLETGWNPTLSPSEAVKVAREELPHYVGDPAKYRLKEVTLARFRDTDWWLYLVSYQEAGARKVHARQIGYVRIVVLPSGKAVQGTRD